jgi:hypothetical protein
MGGLLLLQVPGRIARTARLSSCIIIVVVVFFVVS